MYLTPHPTESVTGRFRGGPHRPLMAMVEITARCNMACPLCFAGSTKNGADLPLAEITRRLRNLLHTAGPVPLQISGGEPTMHPQLPKIICGARELGFTKIELVTNGIRISEQGEYLKRLVEEGLTSVYLQFDGLRKTTYLKIRGRDMSRYRLDSIEAIRAAGLCCTLAVAVVEGVNDHELGDIVHFAANHIDTVRAVNFQAAARFNGRFALTTQSGGYSLDALVARIEEQIDMESGGFSTALLGHRHCNAMSLVFLVDGKFKPLFACLSENLLREYLGTNKREFVSDLLLGKEHFSRKHLFRPKAWSLLRQAATIFGKNPRLQTILQTKHLLLFAKSFMEKSTLSCERIQQCNYGIAAADGVYCFCAYNNLHRTP